nr:hypothetical protein [Tanacetum cinerariifolium]
QDRATVAKSSTLPHDSAPKVTSPAAAEGTQEVEINRLKASVKLLEDREGVAAERSGDDAPIKGRNLDEGRQQMRDGSIPTASPPAAEVPTGSDVVPTSSLVFATATVIDAQVARELEEQLEREDQRMSEQIAREAEVVRIHVKEELQSMIDGLDRSNETVAKYLQEYQQFSLELPLERRIELISDLVRGMSFEEIKAKFTKVWKQLKDFIPMGSKEEAKKLKRKGLSLEQESAKKLKTSEEVPEEVKSPDEVPKEKRGLESVMENSEGVSQQQATYQ